MWAVGEEVWIGSECLGVCSMTCESVWKVVGEDYDGIEKMKVPGGWLYRTRVTSGGQELSITSVALAFVPRVPEPASKKKAKWR
jgi:hypothetical protein